MPADAAQEARHDHTHTHTQNNFFRVWVRVGGRECLHSAECLHSGTRKNFFSPALQKMDGDFAEDQPAEDVLADAAQEVSRPKHTTHVPHTHTPQHPPYKVSRPKYIL